MIIGILALQGNLSEHAAATKAAMKKLRISGEVIFVKNKERLAQCDGLLIPGGESTTFWKLMRKTDLFNPLQDFVKAKPVFGTCAGLIVLAKGGGKDAAKTGQELLGVLDAKVDRNAFGRQVDSFSVDIPLKNIGKFHCVFIRAPAVESVGKGVEVLGTYKGKIIAVRQGNILATAFHPELTDDTRVHEYFIRLIGQDPA